MHSVENKKLININPKFKYVNIIGCGFAGIETALFLAGHGIKIHVFNISQNNFWKDVEDEEDYKSFNLLLEKELAFLGSPIAKEYQRKLEKGERVSEEYLYNFGLNMVKDNENIEYFEASIEEINPSEINIIATGNNTDKNIFSFFVKRFGSQNFQSTLLTFPLLSNIDNSFIIQNPHKKDEYYLPLTYEEYILFVTKVKDEINLLKSENIKLLPNSIEYMVDKGFEYLKNQSMQAVYCEGRGKPYATIRLKRAKNGFELQNIGSNLQISSQIHIFHSLNCFKNAIIEREASIKEGSFINSQYIINEFGQSLTQENLFFAGSLLGLNGWRQCDASGLMTALGVIKHLCHEKFVPFPSKTGMGKIKEALTNFEKTSNYASRLKSLIHEYEDIAIEELFKNSIRQLEKFKEEYNNGKYV